MCWRRHLNGAMAGKAQRHSRELLTQFPKDRLQTTLGNTIMLRPQQTLAFSLLALPSLA